MNHEKQSQWDQILKDALAPAGEPDEALNETVIRRAASLPVTRASRRRRRLSVPAIAVALTLALSVSVYAATRLLTPGEVATRLEQPALAQAFKDGKAVEIHESITSGGYIFTLQGLLPGNSLAPLTPQAEHVSPDKTYVVISIAKTDGGTMPDPQSPDYAKNTFFVTPLIKGQKPWQVNIALLNGGYSEFWENGVLYRIIECDSLEMFADRGLYLAVSSGALYDSKAFSYDEATGEVSLNQDYDRAHALFNLPLDASKADRAQAEQALAALFTPQEEPKQEQQEEERDWSNEIKKGIVIPGSIQKLTPDKDGLVHYSYRGGELSAAVSALFAEGQPGDSPMIFTTHSDQAEYQAVQFTMEKDGSITGKTYDLPHLSQQQ